MAEEREELLQPSVWERRLAIQVRSKDGWWGEKKSWHIPVTLAEFLRLCTSSTVQQKGCTREPESLSKYLIGDLGVARRHLQRLLHNQFGKINKMRIYEEIRNSVENCVERIERDLR